MNYVSANTDSPEFVVPKNKTHGLPSFEYPIQPFNWHKFQYTV